MHVRVHASWKVVVHTGKLDPSWKRMWPGELKDTSLVIYPCFTLFWQLHRRFLHPPFHFLSLLNAHWCWVLPGACPSRHRARVGYTLDRSPVYHSVYTDRQTSTFTFTPADSSEAFINLKMNTFGLWGEARENCGCRRWVSMTQTPTLSGPSCCEGTVLTNYI